MPFAAVGQLLSGHKWEPVKGLTYSTDDPDFLDAFDRTGPFAIPFVPQQLTRRQIERTPAGYSWIWEHLLETPMPNHVQVRSTTLAQLFHVPWHDSQTTLVFYKTSDKSDGPAWRFAPEVGYRYPAYISVSPAAVANDFFSKFVSRLKEQVDDSHLHFDTVRILWRIKPQSALSVSMPMATV